jgi:hypothetical protein
MSNVEYRQWIDRHCRKRTCTFQIKKCDDAQCCNSPKIPLDFYQWLSDPELAATPDDAAALHYKKFNEVYGKSDDKKHKPSLVAVSKTKSKSSDDAVKQLDMNLVQSCTMKDASVYAEQCAKDIVFCTECRKPKSCIQ